MTDRFFVFLLLTVAMTACSCSKESISDDEKIRNYLAENAIKAERHESGLYYVITQEGLEGEHPSPQSNVTVLYKGYLLDGRVFDQTVTQQPVSFNLQGVIDGWKIGIPLMEKKGKATFFVPSALGYGSRPPSAIPKNAVLIFDVELINFD